MSIEELETLRIKAKNSVMHGSIIAVVISIVLTVLMKSFIFIVFGVVIGIFITIIMSRKPTQEFIREYKKTFVLKSLENTFDNLVYHPERGLNESIIRNTQMMDMGDRYSSNDFISGTYKDINFIQSDIHIEEEYETTDSDGNTSTTWVTLFLGRWMIFDFNKPFKANIQVSQKGFGNSKITNYKEKVKFKKVMMEDQEFNNNFRVYAQSEHEAFYILTPSLMEKIKTLANSLSGKILLCFIDNKLHIGLQNYKDSFEHSIFTKIEEEKITDEISKDIKIITKLVDELDLDNDLFKRKGV